MFSFLLFHGIALLTLGLISFQDWKNEKFNVFIPLAGFTAIILTGYQTTGSGYTGLTLIYLASIIGVYKKYIRLGDVIPIGLYSYAFTSLQSFFTLMTVTGLYLYTYPKLRDEKQWIPYLPALLLSYLVQLLVF